MLNDKSQLPRLLTDPVSGETVLEFSQTRKDGCHVSLLDRQVIRGVFRGKFVANSDDTICQALDGKAVLRVGMGFYPTDHSYDEIRDLLWPIEKTEVY